ncbi:hypothetical protein LshimejAT787_0700890 [Lyophyllum shimeji]|uniref:Uncharacterized protein n=1 Tax=Lyophyllum shimeji TaxID=47721 RepID=A0A9P3ULR3_LYOSH|nr:hypothetical protein LshimejAT787_0700890 [Lyophyllum shimeji]
MKLEPQPKKFQFFPHVRLLVIVCGLGQIPRIVEASATSWSLSIFFPRPGSLLQNTISEDSSQHEKAPISTVPSSGPASASPPRTPAVPHHRPRSGRPPSSSSNGQGQDQHQGATSEIAWDLAMGIPAFNFNEVADTKEFYPA